MTRKRRRSTKSRRALSSSISRLFVSCALVHLFAWSSLAAGTEVSIPALRGSPGDVVRVPVLVGAVDNLAGVKLVLSYDPDLLTFKQGGKTKHTDSLMHIVNDKTPGRLIAVMAGARGIRGEDFPILTLTFMVSDSVKGERTTVIDIVHVEMMSDDLESIPCSVRSEPFLIIPRSDPE